MLDTCIILLPLEHQPGKPPGFCFLCPFKTFNTMPRLIDLDKLVSIADYAVEQKCTKQAVYARIATGAVKHEKVGKLILIIR